MKLAFVTAALLKLAPLSAGIAHPAVSLNEPGSAGMDSLLVIGVALAILLPALRKR